MSDLFNWLFDSRNFMPHGHCYLWRPDVLLLQVGSDALIAASYFAIPMILVIVQRRSARLFPYPWITTLFATFILLCGTTHIVSIWTVWHPEYVFDGVVKLATGVVSAATSLALFWITPQLLSLKTPAELQAEVDLRTSELASANAKLLAEVRAREQSELALRRSDEQLRLITDALPVVIAYIDTDLRYRFRNAVQRDWIQGTSQDVTGLHIRDVLGERVFEELKADFECALRGESVRAVRRIHFPHRTSDVDMQLIPRRDGGKVVGFIALIEDIGERLAADHERSRLAAIVESSNDAIIGATLPGVVNSWNGGATKLFGYTADEMKGQSLQAVLPTGIAAHLSAFDRADSDAEHSHFESTAMRKDGQRITISVTVSPVCDQNGVVVGCSTVARDISERKRAEEALREADRRKDEFLAVLAHELRNPLAPIRTAVQFLRIKGSSDTALQSAREIIERQVRHMVRLVDDLLEVSRITRGKISLHKEHIELEAIFAHATEAAQPLINAAHHKLSVAIQSRSIEVYADITRISQVLLNLLNNAAKFTPPGGHIELWAEVKENIVEIHVRDNGIGIAPEQEEQIFELFYQSDREQVHARGGLGIGLTLARTMTRLHDGELRVVSGGVGQGSEFILQLPIAHPRASTIAPPVQDRVTSRSNRILVVDDNVDAANSLAMLLLSEGHEVKAVYSGMQALDVLEVFAPDVVVLDIGMPSMSGYEVARRIRTMQQGQAPLLIALTGWGQASDKRRAADAGFDEHLTKPVDPNVLMSLIATRFPLEQDAKG